MGPKLSQPAPLPFVSKKKLQKILTRLCQRHVRCRGRKLFVLFEVFAVGRNLLIAKN